MTWTMTYRVLDGAHIVTELTATDNWHVLTPAQLTAETAAHGYHCSH